MIINNIQTVVKRMKIYNLVVHLSYDFLSSHHTCETDHVLLLQVTLLDSVSQFLQHQQAARFHAVDEPYEQFYQQNINLSWLLWRDGSL